MIKFPQHYRYKVSYDPIYIDKQRNILPYFSAIAFSFFAESSPRDFKVFHPLQILFDPLEIISTHGLVNILHYLGISTFMDTFSLFLDRRVDYLAVKLPFFWVSIIISYFILMSILAISYLNLTVFF